jgi:hypothetical protein
MNTKRKIIAWIGMVVFFDLTCLVLYFIIFGKATFDFIWEPIGICLTLIIATAAFGKQALKIDYQRLVIFVPVPADATPETVPLLLDFDDSKIYYWIKTHGKTTRTENGVKIAYKGPKIYYRTSNKFKIDGVRYVPKAIRVLHRFTLKNTRLQVSV